MNGNLGKTDRLVRITSGLFVLLIGLLLDQWWGVLGAIPLFTGVAGWCPLYALIGLSTAESFHWTRSNRLLNRQER